MMHLPDSNPTPPEQNPSDRSLFSLSTWIVRAVALLSATAGTACIFTWVFKSQPTVRANDILTPAAQFANKQLALPANFNFIPFQANSEGKIVSPPQLTTQTKPEKQTSQINILPQLSLKKQALTSPPTPPYQAGGGGEGSKSSSLTATRTPPIPTPIPTPLPGEESKISASPTIPTPAIPTPLPGEESKISASPTIPTPVTPTPPFREKNVFRYPLLSGEASDRWEGGLGELGSPSPSKPALELKLSDAVVLVLQNNREIKNAYLDRIAQREDLAVAESKFNPTWTPQISVAIDRNVAGDAKSYQRGLNVSAAVTVTIPTGGEVTVGWVGTGRSQIAPGLETNADDLNQNLQLRFKQPLLRGFGVAVNNASIEMARLNEQVNILSLKSTLAETITRVILAYRTLVQAQERVKIQQSSLASARQQLEITQAFIEAGQLARVEIIQNETDIANREVSLLEAENNRESVKLQLLDLLDIDQNLNLVAAEIPSGSFTVPDLSNLRQIALEKNPAYLQARLSKEIAQYNFLLAEDEKRWDLDFEASYGNTTGIATDKSTDLRAGLTLQRQFGDRSVEQRYQQSRVNLLKAENTLENQRESLEIEVADKIRNVNLLLKQVELARRARELSEQKLENEREKLRLGLRNTRLIDVLNFQSELVQAKNAELGAIINYLNALTELDRSVGTTLETWQVTVEVK